ncbi:MAG TPA: TfoX/Sxy family protein [Usitatibacteraceae bacterium]|nr:TfoX/Sxy family protein [Usitatibacteraceae bacterium]
MTKRSEYVEYVIETMRAFGAVEAKAMFGGWGLYHQGAFFALVAGDVLYLKTDHESRPRFEAAGLEPFVFQSRDGQKTAMSYRRAPDEALENPAVMAEWARYAYEAALRAAAKKEKSRSAKAATPPRSPARPRRGN